jgi:hypothetical protein
MKIHCTTTFLDGRDRFEAGETRVVDAERAKRFIAAGWASAEGEPATDLPELPATDLTIHSTRQEQEARHG